MRCWMRAAGVGVVSATLAGATAAEPPSIDTRFELGYGKSVQCVACHGVGGMAPNPTFPNLAGQNAGYLELQLTRFRSGERHHPLMSPIAESLSDADIGSLAVFYSALRPQAGEPETPQAEAGR